MTSKSLRHFVGATVSADNLFERYKIACDLKQPVNQEKITLALQRWADKIEISGVAIKFVTNSKEVEEAARDAWDAWAARDARDAWDAWAARDARDARDAWDAWDAWAARDARDARDAWDLSYMSTAAIGASSEGEQETLEKWLPIFEAFEAGAFCLWIGAETIYVAVLPTKVLVDDQRRLHCENGPAFAWIDDVRDYYWRGVHVPESWIMDRASLTAETALSEQNIERRRAACEILGWDVILKKLGAVTVDRDGDPQIGELVEVKLPGEGKEKITARYLRVQCGTGRQFAVCVPPNTKTALDAQAWMLGLPIEKFQRPEIRT